MTPETAAPLTAVLFSLSSGLIDITSPPSRPPSAATPPQQYRPSPGALALLSQLQQQQVPCAWLEQATPNTCRELSQQLPPWLIGFSDNEPHLRTLPAPDRIWVALARLAVPQVQGCVLVSGDPLLLQAGLNAGLWTIGLALCSPLCRHTAERLDQPPGVRERQRSQATLNLYRLGVHSVIDQLSDAPSCLADLSQRRSKGEKP